MLTTSHPEILESARQMLDHEWQRLLEALPEGAPARAAGPCPLRWVLADLLDLVAELHDRPVAEVRQYLHRIVSNHRVVIETMLAMAPSADAQAPHAAPPDIAAAIDRQVDLAVQVLEKVRRLALARGQWSEAPAAPLMFG